MFQSYVYKFKSTKWAYLKKILVEKETLETWAVFSMEKGGGLYLGLCSNSFDSVDGDFTGCFTAADLKEIDISQYLSFKECCMIV